MKTFQAYLEESHPDFEIDEGWRDWAKGAVLGAAGLGAAIGGYSQLAPKSSPDIDNRPAAVQHEPGSSLLSHDTMRKIQDKKARIASMKDQMKGAGVTTGKFRHGELQKPSGQGGGQSDGSGSTITRSSTAGSYFNK